MTGENVMMWAWGFCCVLWIGSLLWDKGNKLKNSVLMCLTMFMSLSNGTSCFGADPDVKTVVHIVGSMSVMFLCTYSIFKMLHENSNRS